MKNATKNVTLRATRIAAVQQALYAKRVAAKQAKYVAAQQAYTAAQQAIANKQAYLAEIAALATKYGITAPQQSVTKAPRSSGACAQVWAIAAQHGYDRKATLAACVAAGINAATAATQFALAKRAHPVAA